MKNKVLEQWNLAANEYSQSQVNSIYSQFNRKFVKNTISNISGLKVLDAGCGDGYYSNLFQEKGADVIGCDGSIEMIEIAKSKYPSCRFDVVDLQNIMPYTNKQFDFVFCNLVLMDIESIDRLVTEIARILIYKGKFFFTIVHPAFYLADWEKDEQGKIHSKKVIKYITVHSEINNFWGSTMHYHRPISYYFNKISDNGFVLKKMYEPEVYEEQKIPDIPLFLFAEFIKN